LLAAACGGSSTSSVPPHLVIPVPPAERTGQPCPKAPEPARSPQHNPAGARPPAQSLAVPPAVQKLVDAPDRTDDDKKLDGGRHPAELLAFLALAPGMRVAEIGAGGGYTSELLARAVGPKGKVWAQNNKFILERFADKPLAARMAKPAFKDVIVRIERDFDAPLPPDAKNLDAVVSVLFYHDTVWIGADRDKMNKAVFDALRHGGEYVVVDHSAAEGRGTADVKDLHRIDELTVLREVERAGFHQAGSADFLRNPSDDRGWNDAPMAAAERRGTSDRFVLKFVKP
jgi:predicted methyltransferase